MIKMHVRNTEAIRVTNELFDAFFAEADNAIHKLRPIYNLLTDFIEGNAEEEDVFDELDGLVLKVKNIYVVAECLPSANDSNNKYLRRTVYSLELFMRNVEHLTSVGRYPDEKDAAVLREQVFAVIGGLSYFLLFDFGIDDLLCRAASKQENNEIDEIVANYCRAKNIEPIKLGIKLTDIYKEFKFRFDVFDECPEYEEEFEKIAGPDYNIIPEEILTVELVKQIVEGKLSMQEFLDTYCADGTEGA